MSSSMALIDLLNWVGRRKYLRPVGVLLLCIATKLRFSMLIRVSGRRIVAASAGAPAVLLTDKSMREVLSNPKLLFEAMKLTIEKMDLDVFCLVADMSIEAEACGCQIQFHEKNLPTVISHPVKTSDDVMKLEIPDPYRDGRMPVFLEAMRLAKDRYTILKVPIIIGPFTLASHLSGTGIYLDIRKDPEKVKLLLDYCQKVIIAYGQALIDVGADMIMIAEPIGSQLSPALFKEFSQPYIKKIIHMLTKPCILHICGKTSHIIEDMCKTGAVALSIDDIEISTIIKSVPTEIVLIGNISTLSFLRTSPEEIKRETDKLLDLVNGRKEFIVAPGCDLSPETPFENICSFVHTVKQYKPKNLLPN